jgi:D-glycero-alpha-D-manno-heptose-7-phosphate kinase
VSFAGGGTDLKSFWQKEFGAVLSCTIDRYMFITVNHRFDHTVRVSYAKTEIAETAARVRHPIVREALKLTGLEQGLEITSIADIPSGTGLGSSSSFAVGLLHALYAYKGEHASAERAGPGGMPPGDPRPEGAHRQAGSVHRGLRRPAVHPVSTRRDPCSWTR